MKSLNTDNLHSKNVSNIGAVQFILTNVKRYYTQLCSLLLLKLNSCGKTI